MRALSYPWAEHCRLEETRFLAQPVAKERTRGEELGEPVEFWSLRLSTGLSTLSELFPGPRSSVDWACSSSDCSCLDMVVFSTLPSRTYFISPHSILSGDFLAGFPLENFVLVSVVLLVGGCSRNCVSMLVINEKFRTGPWQYWLLPCLPGQTCGVH